MEGIKLFVGHLIRWETGWGGKSEMEEFQRC